MSDVIQPSTIAQPAKCKICGGVIGHFALTWPPPEGSSAGFNQEEFGRLAKAVAQHMQNRAGTVVDRTNQHQGALAMTQVLAGNYQQVLLFRYFQLPEAAEAYAEQIRGSVNHTTSKFTLTPEYAEQIADEIAHSLRGDEDDCEISAKVKEALLAIAARYEEGHPEPTPSSPNVN